MSGQVGRVVHLDVLAVGLNDFVDDAGIGGDDVHVVFPAEAFLDDLHVEKTEEAAAKTEAEGDGAFGLEDERGVIELELRHCRLQVLEIRGIDGVNTAEDHGMDFLEAGQGFLSGFPGVGQGIADLDVGRALDVGDEVSDIAGIEARLRKASLE